MIKVSIITLLNISKMNKKCLQVIVSITKKISMIILFEDLSNKDLSKVVENPKNVSIITLT